MKERINSIVSMYKRPVLGTVKAKRRYMALAVDKSALNKKIKLGVAREITGSRGSVDEEGFIDESKLILVRSPNLLKWKKISDLEIDGIDQVIKRFGNYNLKFIGLEDPSIVVERGVTHLYFTIAYKLKNRDAFAVFLGHAKGKNLSNLVATDPVLSPRVTKNNVSRGFKEVSISPTVTKKGRINITESTHGISNTIIIAAFAETLDPPWKLLKTVLNPKKLGYDWCEGDLSPCCFLPIKVKGLLVGIINGRQKPTKVKTRVTYGKFRPGLILFNPKTGKIPWISPEPLFEDPDATTITFASDFVKLSKDKGILYCHINDSFVRAYEVDLKELKDYVKKNFKN
jgi:hypothetical protein